MPKFPIAAAAFAALALASCDKAPPPSISVENAWARTTLPGQSASAAYFTIRNTGGADRLLSVSIADGTATLHSTSMDGGVMRMRPLGGLDVPANSTVELKPGGTHVMLMGLRAPLMEGKDLPMTLKFAKSGDRRVSAEIRSAPQGAM